MRFSILSWNIGYGGMGGDAYSLYEGPLHRFRMSRPSIQENIRGIGTTLGSFPHDVLLLQEVAGRSILNRWHNLYGHLSGALDAYEQQKASVFRIPILPERYSSEHSLLTCVRRTHRSNAVTHRLKEHETYAGIIKRNDSVIVTTLGALPLTVIHVHLAAFDTDMRTRRGQLKEIMAFATEAHTRGPVIVGGDWNMTITRTHSRERPDLPYLTPFARDLVPEKWHVVSGENVPSLRSGKRPWNNRSVTATVDGFVVSPDVRITAIKTYDLDFRYSDHNPVELFVEL